MQVPVAVAGNLVDDPDGGSVLRDGEPCADAEAVDLGARVEQLGDAELVQVAAGENSQELDARLLEVVAGEAAELDEVAAVEPDASDPDSPVAEVLRDAGGGP